jgi:excisionase family DNA binding protein
MNIDPRGATPTLLLTVEETAAELRIARRRVFTLISGGELRSVKIGKSRRVRSADLADYVARLSSDNTRASV